MFLGGRGQLFHLSTEWLVPSHFQPAPGIFLSQGTLTQHTGGGWSSCAPGPAVHQASTDVLGLITSRCHFLPFRPPGSWSLLCLCCLKNTGLPAAGGHAEGHVPGHVPSPFHKQNSATFPRPGVESGLESSLSGLHQVLSTSQDSPEFHQRPKSY